jgi:hypothetical protein
MTEKPGPVRFAYAVLAVERKTTLDGAALEHAPAAPRIGAIQVFDRIQGSDSVIQEQTYDDDVPIVDLVHLRYIGRGYQLPDGDVDFDYETKRLLALIQIGAEQERVLHAEIDRVFDRFEEFVQTTDLDTMTNDSVTEALGRLRREFA